MNITDDRPEVRRELTPEECEELIQFSRRTKWWGWFLTIAVTVLASCFIFGWMIGSAPPPLQSLPFDIIAGFALLLWLWRFSDVLFMRNLREAARLGYVIVLHTRLPQGSSPVAGVNPGEELVLEKLPTMKAFWTINGKPSGWRKGGDEFN
jgi:hypothetical protein